MFIKLYSNFSITSAFVIFFWNSVCLYSLFMRLQNILDGIEKCTKYKGLSAINQLINLFQILIANSPDKVPNEIEEIRSSVAMTISCCWETFWIAILSRVPDAFKMHCPSIANFSNLRFVVARFVCTVGSRESKIL